MLNEDLQAAGDDPRGDDESVGEDREGSSGEVDGRGSWWGRKVVVEVGRGRRGAVGGRGLVGKKGGGGGRKKGAWVLPAPL